MIRHTRVTRSFVATDAGGDRYTLRLVADSVTDDAPGRPATATVRRVATEAGEPVVRTADGDYLVVPSGVRLVSDDPDAA